MRKLLLSLLFLCFISIGIAAEADTITIWSEAMNKSIKNVVVLPDSYSENAETYHVVYLLHGAGGYYGSWLIIAPQIMDYADHYQTIVVCPDGGYTSWYFDSPIDPAMKYETYISKELISYIDQNYHTGREAADRAISGLSMGGHGALYLAFRHPDVFGAAGSSSGGVDIRPFPTNWDLPKRLGKQSSHQENWESHTVINMVDQLQADQPVFIIDCGVDDFFLEVNRNLHQALLEHKLPHDYIERPGDHTLLYWRNSIAYHFLFFNEFFMQKIEK